MNEQNLSQSNKPIQGSKNIWIITVTVIVIVTFLVAGSVYVWQYSNLKSTEQSLRQQITALRNQISQLQQIQIQQDQKIVEVIHKENLRYILDGNAKAIANAFSEDYMDMGGGLDGDGITNIHTVDFWKTKFSNDNFNDIRDKSIEELVDLNNIQIYTYPNIEEKYSHFVCANTRITFKCENGDIFIFFLPTEDSLLFDGWFGIYRKINSEWKIVAGD